MDSFREAHNEFDLLPTYSAQAEASPIDSNLVNDSFDLLN